MKAVAAKLRGILNRPRVVHYADIFLAAFGTELVYERQEILGAHGLNAVGCIALAATITAAKATLEAYRKSTPPSSSSSPPPPPST